MMITETTMTMTDRNTAICAMYVAGSTLQVCAEKYAISRERVRQILRKAGVFKRDRMVEKSDREAFIGVNVSETTKTAVKALADERGISVSRMTSDMLDEMVK